MILVLEKKITHNQKDKIKNMLSDEGCMIREIFDAGRNIIGIIGNCKKSENASVRWISRLSLKEGLHPQFRSGLCLQNI